MVLPWMIPGWRRNTQRERQMFMRSAILLPAKLAIPAGVILGGNLVIGIVLALAFAVLFLIIARLVAGSPAIEQPAV